MGGGRDWGEGSGRVGVERGRGGRESYGGTARARRIGVPHPRICLLPTSGTAYWSTLSSFLAPLLPHTPCPAPLSPSPELYAFSPPRIPPAAAFPSSSLTVSFCSFSTNLPTSHQMGKSKDPVWAHLTPPSDARHYVYTFCDNTMHSNPPLFSRKRNSMGTGRPAPGDSSSGAPVSRPWHGRARQRPFQFHHVGNYLHEEVLKPEYDVLITLSVNYKYSRPSDVYDKSS